MNEMEFFTVNFYFFKFSTIQADLYFIPNVVLV